MFKLVALCALVAVASASPDTIISSPLAYSYSAGLSPAVTYSSPVYSATTRLNTVFRPPYLTPAPFPADYGFAHLIKKRSAPLLSTFYSGNPLTTTYSASVPLSYSNSYPLYSTPFATTYSSPLVHSSAIYPTAHLIKKRDVGLVVPSTYSYTGNPYIAPTSYSYGTSVPYIPSPYFSTGPLAYTQFIKK
ncbi:uncharacterized protein LOC126977330 [Leptidea sinapis]|uniref:uncharacterized protein LOC126977330 n=1 Tax=Leptidea sinapis TaxID=189913 RepID=UPI0021C29401|nr:uncharacterized protein LOC126977330 [Leptidea sinapis]